MHFNIMWSWSNVWIELELGESVFVKGGEPENLEKNPQNRNDNQQQTQPTVDAGSRNWTQVTVVGGERSHHCTIPAPSLHLHLWIFTWSLLPLLYLLKPFQADAQEWL